MKISLNVHPIFNGISMYLVTGLPIAASLPCRADGIVSSVHSHGGRTTPPPSGSRCHPGLSSLCPQLFHSSEGDGSYSMPCRSGCSVPQFWDIWLTHLFLASQTSLFFTMLTLMSMWTSSMDLMVRRRTFLHQAYCLSLLQYLVPTPMPLLGPLT